MKTYEYQDAVETLFGLLSVQDKQLLAKELAKLIVKYSDSLDRGWTIKDIDLSLTKEGTKFRIKVGNEC